MTASNRLAPSRIFAVGIAACVLCLWMPRAEARQADAGLFTIAPLQAAAPATSGAAVRSRLVSIDRSRLRPFLAPGEIAADAASLTLNLFPDLQVTAQIERVEPSLSGIVVRGRVADDAESSVALAVVGNVIAGKVAVGGNIYVINHVADEVHVIQQIDQSQLPPEAPPLEPPALPAQPMPPGIAADDGSIIDLLVAYTPEARSRQGGTASMEALIDLGVSETNQAYASSGATQRLRLVHRTEINYVESGNYQTDLNRLTNTADGFMDSIHTLRDSYGADLVQLIEYVPSVCGVAWVMLNVSTGFAPNGFGITHYTCVSPNYSFGHEMGHNMGLQHDTYVQPNPGAYDYSHGYVNQAAFGGASNKWWRTIMAYNDQCAANGISCQRLLYFSNPANTYTGDPMGNGSANETLSLNNTASTVANFRQSVNRTLSINDVTISEGQSGTKTADFTVTLSSSAAGPTTVNYSTEDVTAWSAAASNPQAVTIGTNPTASPYPSQVTVPAGVGIITKVTVVLRNFTHTYPDDVNVLLVGPGGEAALLMSAVGGSFDASGITLTFDADAGTTLPDSSQLVTGTFRPQATHNASFPAPAPSIPTPNTTPLTVFNGTNPSGTWQLYVYDSYPAGDTGSIAGGWQLNVATTASADYVPASGVATIPAGATTQTVSITINGDGTIEPAETFKVNLSNAVGATISDGVGIGTITNDDHPPFTDTPLTAESTIVKAIHITELRDRVNAARVGRGLSTVAWTDATLSAGSSAIKAVHIAELRTALAAVYTAAGVTPPTYTDASLSGVMIKAVHITELRNAVIAIE